MKDISNLVYKELMIKPSDSISFALKRMCETNRKLLIVLDSRKVIGLLSIGDIQRAIIANIKMDTEVNNILRVNITIAKSTEDIDCIKKKMLLNRIEYMPIIGSDNELVKILFWEDVFEDDLPISVEKLSEPVVIMAGGVGARLRPLTNIIPKALVPVGEKPIIQEIVDRFYSQGSNRFFLSINYKGDMIKKYFDELDSKKYRIEYLQELDFRGTAGSLSLVLGKLDSTFIVSNCDIIVEQDYSEIIKYHKKNNNLITIISAIKTHSIPYGVLNTCEDGLLESIDEKPELIYKINTGVYILEPSVLEFIPVQGVYQMTDLICDLKKNGLRIGVFPVGENAWYDMGEWSEFRKMQQIFYQNKKR